MTDQCEDGHHAVNTTPGCGEMEIELGIDEYPPPPPILRKLRRHLEVVCRAEIPEDQRIGEAFRRDPRLLQEAKQPEARAVLEGLLRDGGAPDQFEPLPRCLEQAQEMFVKSADEGIIRCGKTLRGELKRCCMQSVLPDLLERHGPWLRGIIDSLMKRRRLDDDMLQDMAVACIESAPSFDPSKVNKSSRSWLAKIVTTAIVNYRRDEHRTYGKTGSGPVQADAPSSFGAGSSGVGSCPLSAYRPAASPPPGGYAELAGSYVPHIAPVTVETIRDFESLDRLSSREYFARQEIRLERVPFTQVVGMVRVILRKAAEDVARAMAEGNLSDEEYDGFVTLMRFSDRELAWRDLEEVFYRSFGHAAYRAGDPRDDFDALAIFMSLSASTWEAVLERFRSLRDDDLQVEQLQDRSRHWIEVFGNCEFDGQEGAVAEVLARKLKAQTQLRDYLCAMEHRFGPYTVRLLQHYLRRSPPADEEGEMTHVRRAEQDFRGVRSEVVTRNLAGAAAEEGLLAELQVPEADSPRRAQRADQLLDELFTETGAHRLEPLPDNVRMPARRLAKRSPAEWEERVGMLTALSEFRSEPAWNRASGGTREAVLHLEAVLADGAEPNELLACTKRLLKLSPTESWRKTIHRLSPLDVEVGLVLMEFQRFLRTAGHQMTPTT